MKKHILDLIGSFVDEMFLAPGRLIAYFQSQRDIDWRAFALKITLKNNFAN
jgi:hypothetical protein